MMIKFFKGGRDNGKSAIEYLVGARYKRKQAIIVKGDCELSKKIIRQSDLSEKYVSGVLSFSESHIDRITLLKVITEFEDMFLPDYSAAEYNSLWVKHKDKDRIELHFVFPTIHILNNSRLNIYNSYKDFDLSLKWQTYINSKYGFDDPFNAENFNILSYSSRLPNNVREEAKAISRLASIKFWNESLSNSEDLFKLIKDNKLEILEIKGQSLLVQSKAGLKLKFRCKLLDPKISYEEERSFLQSFANDHSEYSYYKLSGLCEKLALEREKKLKLKKTDIWSDLAMLARRYEEVLIGKEGMVSFAGEDKYYNEVIKYGDESIYSEFNRLIRNAIASIRKVVERYESLRKTDGSTINYFSRQDHNFGKRVCTTSKDFEGVRIRSSQFEQLINEKFRCVVGEFERVRKLVSKNDEFEPS
ncbi:MAG: relaxase/mobilization nuclease domain-containing protein [Moraxellaceae bacterium]|nr:relaxase/mobilization nuclease domain-containing protein [Moraxellaceae bacterium]